MDAIAIESRSAHGDGSQPDWFAFHVFGLAAAVAAGDADPRRPKSDSADGETAKPVREQRDDGCVEETLPAIAVAAKVLEDRQVECCRWLLDASVSNGGRLGTILREYAADAMDPRSCKPGERSPLTEPADRLFG